MKARSPGKLVLSGAYSVLRGAPAIVTAVDRFVWADTSKKPAFSSREVECALDRFESETGARPAHPHVDAGQLRESDRKLGLGSSAAIVTSCVAALLDRGEDEAAFRRDVFERSLVAHRLAQGGGSGIDVAASSFGGTLSAVRTTDNLEVAPLSLPSELVWETWAMHEPASTSEFVARVFGLETSEPRSFLRALGRQRDAAESAVTATQAGDTAGFVAALRAQLDALDALGELAGVSIVLPSVRELHDSLSPDACFLPSGAGGGDVTIHVGPTATSASFRARAHALGLTRVELGFDAPGVTLFSDDDSTLLFPRSPS